MAPDPTLITDLGWELIGDLPPILRDDPDLRAVLHCHAKETERQEATLAEVRAQLVASTATSLGLPWWEALIRTTIDEGTLTDVQRRALISAYIQNLEEVLSRYGWKIALDTILGPGWGYQEYDPADPAVPANTIRVFVPFPVNTTLYAETARLIRRVTDAHIALELIDLTQLPLDFGILDTGGLG